MYQCLSDTTWKEFLSCTAEATDGFGFITENLQDLVHIDEALMTGFNKKPEEGQYNVSRKLLREVLISGIGNKISYGKTFQRYELLQNGKVKVWFDDESSIELIC